MINKRFIVKNKLGEGRSKVFSVVDTEFPEKEIAMKILPKNVHQEEIDAFRYEYFTLRKLDHPSIIKAYDIGNILTIDEDDTDEIETGCYYITIEQLDAIELSNYDDISDEVILIDIIRQICSVLYYLHQSNYIYYDLKPQNILISKSGNNHFLKIIDLGFTRYILSGDEHKIRGTAEYIAPELLKKENHDHTVDFYSLGIILYKIIYGKLPFNYETELDAYKAHIESEFSYPASGYSENLVNVVKKLLNKNPQQRFSNALQVLTELGLEINIELTKDFLPARILCGRQDTLNIVRTYLNDSKSNEIFSLRGFSGAGKSQVLSELQSIYPSSVYIENTRRKTGAELIRFFLHKLLFNEIIFSNISQDDKDDVIRLFESTDFEIASTFRSLLTRLTTNNQLLLLIDDYNLYDEFAKETINELFPILQVNKVKIIIAESSEFDYATRNIFNVRDIHLTPFTDKQLSEYLDMGYYSAFPKQKLKNVILQYSDLLPGSFVQFIKDILILGVMRYESDEVTFVYENEIEKSLSGSNEEIYRLRLSNLTEEELKVAQLISAFNISVEQIVLVSILNKSRKEIESILSILQTKNIINSLSLSNSPNIISDSFKRYIYSTIKEKKKYHLIIASLIKRILPDFNIIEHARQYELAGEILKVIELISKEIRKAENLSAYSYKKKLIEDLLILDIKDDIRTSLHIELVKTLFKISDFNSVLELISKVDLDEIDENSRNELLFIKGSSLISVRKLDEGIKTLNDLLNSVAEVIFRKKILVEIAYAEFEKNNYKLAEEIANTLLFSDDTPYEEKGKCYNLIGMIKVYAEEDLPAAINNFERALEMYQKAKLPRRIAGVEVNLGNIYDMLGNDEKSETHWDNALRINESIGNLEQEAIILMNYSIYFRHKLSFDRSIKLVLRSEQIFSSLGNENYRAVVLTNLGEIYLNICEYQKAYECLTTVTEIFRKLNNFEELANALFDLGKLYYHLKDEEMLDKIINEYELCIAEKGLSSKYSMILEIMKLFKDFTNDVDIDIAQASQILAGLLKAGENRLFIDFLIILINYFVHRKEVDKYLILDFMHSNVIMESWNTNYLMKAYKEYFLGKISLDINAERLSPPLEHFEKALSLIENESITELTWQVLAAISESYIERGYVNKAKKPLFYAAELLNYIADNIKKSDIRTKYLNDSERKKIFEQLKIFNNPVDVQ
ncbi:MAG: protein kinase [Ignavibacteriaceae bacterium]